VLATRKSRKGVDREYHILGMPVSKKGTTHRLKADGPESGNKKKGSGGSVPTRKGRK